MHGVSSTAFAFQSSRICKQHIILRRWRRRPPTLTSCKPELRSRAPADTFKQVELNFHCGRHGKDIADCYRGYQTVAARARCHSWMLRGEDTNNLARRASAWGTATATPAEVKHHTGKRLPTRNAAHNERHRGRPHVWYIRNRATFLCTKRSA